MEPHELAHATFTISGDNVLPDFWTKYFGVTPDIARRKDDPFTTKRGQVLRNWTGVWGVGSKLAVRDDSLEPHFRYLIERLALPRSDLRELVERADARMRFFCYWRNESGDRVPDVPGDVREMMEALGGTIEIDEYR
jgi:hypothetical protein